MESTLRPRDIQARIRAGESTESVAQAASTTVDKIMPFANPVLAEREHVAQRAQRSSVRRKAGDQGVRTLGDAVEAQLLPLNVSADVVEWDAWRREDGRWSLTAEFVTSKRKGTATFTFDQPGNYVTTDNDDARWLVGDAVKKAPRTTGRGEAAPDGPDAPDDLERARQRRLQPAGEDELPLGDDAIELANDWSADDPDAVTDDLTETVAAIRADESPEDVDEPELAPTPEPLADEPVAEEPAAEEPVVDEPAVEEPVVEEPLDEPPAPPQPKRPAKKKGRASVPSWDEIMFGGGKQD